MVGDEEQVHDDVSGVRKERKPQSSWDLVNELKSVG